LPTNARNQSEAAAVMFVRCVVQGRTIALRHRRTQVMRG
jgi:hypothetical protein